MDERDRYERGQAVRRSVLGDAHVERALEGRTEFNREFQELLTRYAWGEIWDRPGLTRQTRSLVTLGMLIALNRPDEFQLHVRSAANCGVSTSEIKELLLHSALYCGLPAANAAFHLATDALADGAQSRSRAKPNE